MSEETTLRDEYDNAVKARLAATNDPALNLQAAMRAEKIALLALIQGEIRIAAACIELIGKRFQLLTSGQVDEKG